MLLDHCVNLKVQALPSASFMLVFEDSIASLSSRPPTSSTCPSFTAKNNKPSTTSHRSGLVVVRKPAPYRNLFPSSSPLLFSPSGFAQIFRRMSTNLRSPPRAPFHYCLLLLFLLRLLLRQNDRQEREREKEREVLLTIKNKIF